VITAEKIMAKSCLFNKSLKLSLEMKWNRGGEPKRKVAPEQNTIAFSGELLLVSLCCSEATSPSHYQISGIPKAVLHQPVLDGGVIGQAFPLILWRLWWTVLGLSRQPSTAKKNLRTAISIFGEYRRLSKGIRENNYFIHGISTQCSVDKSISSITIVMIADYYRIFKFEQDTLFTWGFVAVSS
jgi:hypothetical protein